MSWMLTDSSRGIARAAARVRASWVAVTRTLASPRQQPQLTGVPFQWRIPADADLAERVRADLLAIPAQPAIQVQAVRGRVSISGRVRSEDRKAAIELARGVSGVRDVEDLLVCDPQVAG